MALRKTIKAVIYPGEESGYVAECFEIPLVTQGGTLDETVANLREAVGLHFRGEDMAELGFVPEPALIVTYETDTDYAPA